MSQTFNYVRCDGISAEKQAGFKNDFELLEETILMNLCAGRARSLALTKLEETYMWIGKALRDDQIARYGSSTEEPARGEN